MISVDESMIFFFLRMVLLAGRVAVITGAGRGIGARAAELLARHGASVVINDMSAEVLTNTINFFSSTSVAIYLLANCLCLMHYQ